jgi:hypothetical protein
MAKSAQKARSRIKTRRRKQLAEPGERLSEPDAKTVTLTVNGKTMRGKQATVPTGIFPLPQRVRRWAGIN